MIFLDSLKIKSDILPDMYPFNISVIRDFPIVFKNNVTFLVGENGAGKSTILESIAFLCGFNLSGGNKNHLYNQAKNEFDLHSYLTLSWREKTSNGFFMRAESFFNFASYIDTLAEEDNSILKAYGGKSLHKQSHGESFLSLFNNRLSKGLYILDEPEAALSPKRQLTFLAIINELEKSGNAQFIIATHSPILLSYPNSNILFLSDEGINEIDYKETEHYQLTKDFLDSPERYFKHLFKS